MQIQTKVKYLNCCTVELQFLYILKAICKSCISSEPHLIIYTLNSLDMCMCHQHLTLCNDYGNNVKAYSLQVLGRERLSVESVLSRGVQLLHVN